MTTSTKRIRVYNDTRARIDTDVAVKLGITTHHRQAGLVIVAASKRDAIEIADRRSIGVVAADVSMQGRVDPEHGDSLPMAEEALREAGLLTAESVGACYVHTGRPGPVVDMTAPGRPVVGHLVKTNGWGYTFEPVNTPNRLRQAIELIESETAREYGYAALIPREMRDALAIVVTAARKTLPREEN